MAANAYLVDVDESTFQTEVIERSRTELVVVDFWAEWCRPCRQLAPILEGLVHKHPGQLVLARIDTDKNQRLAAGMGIQSIPTVVFFRDGRIVDEFTGSIPERAIEELVARHAVSPIAPLVKQAEASEHEDPAASEQLWLQALAREPENASLHFGLARILLRTNRVLLAAEHLRKAGSLGPDPRSIERLVAALPFFELSTTRSSADGAAGDLSERLRHAAHFATSNQLTAALDELLEIIAIDKNFRDGLARSAMLAIFVLLGPSSDTTRNYQDRLARLLY